VEGREVDAVLDAFEDLIVDESGLAELLAAMNDAMSDGINVGSALNFRDGRAIGSDVADEVFEGGRDVAQGSGESLGGLLAVANMDDGFAADAFNFAAADAVVFVLFDSIEVGRDDLEFEAGATRIQNQDIHRSAFWCSAIGHS
jgi:hypothetical protein